MRAYLRWQVPPISRIYESKLGSSQRQTRLRLQTQSLSSISFSLRQQSLLSEVMTPTLDQEANIFLVGSVRGKGVGCHLSQNPLQKSLPVSVLKMRELELAQKSTIFQSLQSWSWVRLKEGSSLSLITKGLVLAPKTPPLLIPLQQILPLSSSSRMNLSIATNFLILAWRLLTSCETSWFSSGTTDTCYQFGREPSPGPQVQKWPLSHRAAEKSFAAAIATTLSFWKQLCGIRTGVPVCEAPSTPKASAYPHAQTAPSAVSAKECLVPQLILWMWRLGLSKESLLGSSVSAMEAWPSLPSQSRPTVQTPLSLVRKPKWYCPVDTLTTSPKFQTQPGVQYWLLVGLPHPQVVSPQVSRWPDVANDLLMSFASFINLYQTNNNHFPTNVKIIVLGAVSVLVVSFFNRDYSLSIAEHNLNMLGRVKLWQIQLFGQIGMLFGQAEGIVINNGMEIDGSMGLFGDEAQNSSWEITPSPSSSTLSIIS